MREFFGDPDTWTEQAVEYANLYEKSGDLSLLSEAIGLFRRAVTATPSGHPDRPMYLSNLGNALRNHYDRSTQLSMLTEAIEVSREAVACANSDDHAGDLAILAAALAALYQRTGKLEALSEAIQLSRTAAGLIPRGHHDYSSARSNFAGLLQIRYHRLGDLDALAEGIEVSRDALAEARFDDPGRPQYLNNLGVLLRHRYEEEGRSADLSEAIGLTREAVSLTPRAHVDHTLYLANLGAMLGLLYESDGRAEVLSEAIEIGRDTVGLTPGGHPSLPSRLSDLSNMLQIAYERTGNPAEITEAIETLRRALARMPATYVNRARTLANLGTSLQSRYHRTDRPQDLADAIEAGRAAVAATPDGEPEREARLSNLAIMLRNLYERTGNQEALDEAVEKAREAVEITPAGQPRRAALFNGLSNALQALYLTNGELDVLTEAIAASRAAIAAATPGHPGRATMLNSLGTALETQYMRTNDLAVLAEAIAHQRAAVAATSDEHLERVIYLGNLCNRLRLRYERIDVDDDLTEAIEAGRVAVAATPHGHTAGPAALSNLGIALQTRYQRTGEPSTLTEAITLNRAALAAVTVGDQNRVRYQCNLGKAIRSRYEADPDERAALAEAIEIFTEAAESSTTSVRLRLLAQRLLAETIMMTGEYEAAQAAYERAIALLPQVTPLELTHADRQQGLAEMPGLAGEAAAAAIAAGHLDRAVQLLEQARGVLLSEVMVGRGELADLDALAPVEVSARFRQVRKDLDVAELAAVGQADGEYSADPRFGASRSGAALLARRRLAERRQVLAREWGAVLAEIRAIPDLRHFLLPPPVDRLREQAAEGPIVLVNTCRFRCDALVLTADEDRPVRLVELPALTHRAVIDQVNRFRTAIRQAGDPDAERDVRAVLGWLWDEIAEPVMAELGLPAADRDWSRLWWCPVGESAFLPLHAAGHHGSGSADTVLDRVISSYTPTIRALRYARDRDVTSSGPALVVALPETPAASPLPEASAEAAELARLLPDALTLIGSDATHDRVLGALREYPVVHLACHGLSDWNNPARSRLLLHDHETHPLTVAAISRQRLTGAEFAYLSACSTTVANQRLADEAVHITAAFQLAGFRHVIGTLWPISDLIAVRIATDVYATLTAEGAVPPDATRAAPALHQAVRDLRELAPEAPTLWAAHIHAGA